MVDNFSRAVPKPFASKKATKVKGHFSGPTDQLTAIYNALLSSPDLIDVHYQPATRGMSEENTWAFTVEMKPTKRRKEREEPAFEDKSGDIYLMASLEIVGKYKMGHSIHSRQRLGEVITDYGEQFKIIGIHHCSTDRYARETWLKKEVLKWGAKHIERETYLMSDACVERFISLPSE